MRLIACKHIHPIHIRESNGVENDRAASENEMPETSAESIQYFEELLRSKNDQQDRLCDIDTLRINILRRINDLTEIVQSSTNPLALRTATAHVISAITVAHGLQQLDNKHCYDLKPKEKFAANKKFEIQSRFVKTRKERKKPPKLLSLPSAAERKDMKAMLLDEIPQVCAFCFKENDTRGDEDVEWVECPQCSLWAHWECDGNGRCEDTENYLCSVCNSGQFETGENN